MNRRGVSEWYARLGSSVSLHVIAASSLAVIALGLSIGIVANRSASKSYQERILAERRSKVSAVRAQLLPLRDIAKNIELTRSRIDDFYRTRIPANYSRITSDVGAIAIGSKVHLTHIQYSEGEAGSDLAEVSMDAEVSGDYRAVMRFINGLERDRMFYVIHTLSFAGDQGGVVSLRLRMSTWLRSPLSLQSGDSPTLENVNTIAKLDLLHSGGK